MTRTLGRRSIGRRSIVIAGLAVALSSTTAVDTAAAGSGDGSPKVIQLSYFESSGDQGADRGLEAFAVRNLV